LEKIAFDSYFILILASIQYFELKVEVLDLLLEQSIYYFVNWRQQQKLHTLNSINIHWQKPKGGEKK